MQAVSPKRFKESIGLIWSRRTLTVTRNGRRYTASFASSNCVDLKILSGSKNQPWSKHSPDKDLIHNARTISAKQQMNV